MQPETHLQPEFEAPRVRLSWLRTAWLYWGAEASKWTYIAIVAGLIVIAAFAIEIVPFLIGFRANLAALSAYSTTKPGILATEALSFLPITVSSMLNGFMCRLALRQIRGQVFSPGDLFPDRRTVTTMAVIAINESAAVLIVNAGMSFLYLHWPPSTLATIVQTVLSNLTSAAIGAFFMFPMIATADKRMGALDAISTSISLIGNQWPQAFLFCVASELVQGAGSLLCCVGQLITLPVTLIAFTVGYVEFTRVTPRAEPDLAYVWPPPPTIEPPEESR